MSDKKERWHVPALDGLRGIAVLTVILAHTTPQIYPGGNIGVDLFFVLSGYLITTILLKEYDSTNTIRIKNFYLRRVYRLIPALVFFASRLNHLCLLRRTNARD